MGWSTKYRYIPYLVGWYHGISCTCWIMLDHVGSYCIHWPIWCPYGPYCHISYILKHRLWCVCHLGMVNIPPIYGDFWDSFWFMALFYPHHIKHGVKSQTSPGTGRNLGIWQHFFSVPLPTPALLRSWGVQQRDQHPVFSDLLGCGTVRMMANWLVVVYVYIYNINC